MRKIKLRFRLFRAKLAYSYAVCKARQINRMDGKRYYVVMSDSGKLMVIDKDVFYRLRKRGIMPKYVKPSMLTKIAVWYTKGMYKGEVSAEMGKRQTEEKYLKYLEYIKGTK